MPKSIVRPHMPPLSAKKFLWNTVVLLPLSIACASVFIQPWEVSLLWGATAYVALVIGLLYLGHRTRRAEQHKLAQLHGELIVTGNSLTFSERGKPPITVRGAEAIELWYEFNPFGWQHANSWKLIYTVAGERHTLNIFEYEHLSQPLLAWCKEQLQYFDPSIFLKYSNQPGGDSQDILIWSARNDV